MKHLIDLAKAEVEFHKARIAVMVADQAYHDILAKEGLLYKGVEDRLRALINAGRALNTAPDPDPCAHCGAHHEPPRANDHDMEFAIHK